ncbi:MAG: hypothetical protein WAT74_05720 [Flavobacteriales bacterium]
MSTAGRQHYFNVPQHACSLGLYHACLIDRSVPSIAWPTEQVAQIDVDGTVFSHRASSIGHTGTKHGMDDGLQIFETANREAQ